LEPPYRHPLGAAPPQRGKSYYGIYLEKLRWATYRFDPYDRHNLLLYAVVRCLSVCLSFVTFVCCIKTNNRIPQTFSRSDSHTIPVFTHQMLWHYSDGDDPLTCRMRRMQVGLKKSRSSTNIPGGS